MPCLKDYLVQTSSLIFFILDYYLYVVCGLCLISGEEHAVRMLHFERMLVSQRDIITSKCRHCSHEMSTVNT
jgi:hypothetical protein